MWPRNFLGLSSGAPPSIVRGLSGCGSMRGVEPSTAERRSRGSIIRTMEGSRSETMYRTSQLTSQLKTVMLKTAAGVSTFFRHSLMPK